MSARRLVMLCGAALCRCWTAMIQSTGNPRAPYVARSRLPRHGGIAPGVIAWSILVLILRPTLGQQVESRVDEASVKPPNAPRASELLTLAELESLACQHNPTLAQARAHISATAGTATEAGLYPNPELGYMAEQIGVKGTAGEFHGGFVRQEIVTAGKLRLSRAKFLGRMKISQLEALAQEYRVLGDVRIHYYRTLAASRRTGVQRELVKNAEDRVLTTKEMQNVGQANQVDLHQATVALEEVKLNLQMAEIDCEMAWESLMAVVGADLRQVKLAGELQGDTTPTEWESALAHLHAESPELAKAWAKFQADRTTLRREQAEPIPNLVVTGAVGYNAEAEEAVSGAELSMEVPLFDRNQGTIRQAHADLRRQRMEIRRTELMLKRRLADHYRRYRNALRHVQNYEAVILPEAKKAYQVTLQSYRQNRVAWPAVLDAERGYYELRVAYIQHLLNWREAEVTIDALLLVDGLAAPSRPVPPGHIDAVPKPR